ncbi:insulinase family protein, partial [Vibrio parahaemolyticus]|nr:insulinase family protein [Vibrio parahaemolyticus]
VAEAVQAHMPPLYDIYFDNGAELLGTQTTETPTVLVEIKLPAGERHVVPGKEGLANLTAAMLEEGSTTRGVEQIQAQLDKLGSQVSVNANAYSTSIVISSLKKNLAETMNVVEEVLFKPGFRKEDFNRIKQQMIQGVVYQHQQPS